MPAKHDPGDLALMLMRPGGVRPCDWAQLLPYALEARARRGRTRRDRVRAYREELRRWAEVMAERLRAG